MPTATTRAQEGTNKSPPCVLLLNSVHGGLMTFANRLMAGGAGTNATRHRGLED